MQCHCLCLKYFKFSVSVENKKKIVSFRVNVLRICRNFAVLVSK